MKKIIVAVASALTVIMYLGVANADTVNAKFPQFPINKNLPPFAPPSDTYRLGVQAFGAKGGLIDANDNLTDPIQSIVNQPVFSPNNLDNPNMTAGVTFLGQFLDHDITLDKKSELMQKANPKKTVNFRSAAFDLVNRPRCSRHF